MERQANWAVPALVAALAIMTLLAMAAWGTLAFGGTAPWMGGSAAGGPTGGFGMMSNINETAPNGAPSFESMEGMHNGEGSEEMQEACGKAMGVDAEQMDKIHESMHGATKTSTTELTL